MATFRRRSQSVDDEIDSRWKDILEELDDSSAAVVPPLQSLRDLQSTIKSESSKKTPISRQFKDKDYLQRSDFALNPDSLAKLDDILGEELNSDIDEEDEIATNDSSISFNDDDDDALFLDEETYLQYSMLDGDQEGFFTDDDNFISTRAASTSSISLGYKAMDLVISPDAPYHTQNNKNDDSNEQEDQEASMKDILALKQTMAQRRPPSPEEERAIFEEVFRDEQAYFEKTSSIFREGLTNKTAAQAATYMRRNKQYRKNLLKELDKLEKQLQDFEVLLDSSEQEERLLGDLEASNETNHDETPGLIPETASMIDESEKATRVQEEGEEDDAAFGQEFSDDPIEEWILVDDPSTGEVFFWNSRTGEMKISLDDEDGL